LLSPRRRSAATAEVKVGTPGRRALADQVITATELETR
jgi:hypothetical protein